MIYRRLLIIDDSEIDREVLKNILCNDFDIIEADNGYSGLETILEGSPHIDGVLLDISMPVLDGFNVLRLMNENNRQNFPVILITAEATKENVHKAIQYNVSEFISKPFDPNVILSRLRAIFDIQPGDENESPIPGRALSENEISETNVYISKLESIYKGYLKNTDKSDEHYIRTADIMQILLYEYAAVSKSTELNNTNIPIIGKAAYFHDIGHMAVPEKLLSEDLSDETDRRTYESHTNIGADIIWLNHSPSCRFFVKVCGDMCRHHHERFDGKGFPHGIKGDDNSVYTQICSAAVKFDRIFAKRPALNETQFDFVISEMTVDNGEFSPKIIALLKSCRSSLISYYKKNIGIKKTDLYYSDT